MTTLEELKAIGIHGNNLIELPNPTFFHNPFTNEITDEWRDGFDENRYYMFTRRLFPKSDEFQCQIDEINNAKLVLWMPCQSGLPNDIALWFRRAMLRTYLVRLNFKSGFDTTVKLVEIDGFSWTDVLNKMRRHHKIHEEDIEFVK